ncbi:ABC transporter permease [Spirosoma linguale]
MKTSPPRWATRLLHLVCAPHRVDELEDDLNELFYERIESVGLPQARWRYIKDVLSLVRPSLIKRQESFYPKQTSVTMLRNYLKIAFRNLIKNKAYSAINITGLSIGMACSLLIGLWVIDEFNVNKGYKDGDRIYFTRLTDGISTSEIMPGPLAAALKKDIPAVEKVTKFTVWSNDFLLNAGQQSSKKTGIYATEDFFDIFQYPVLQGNPSLAIQSPNNIIITRNTAQTLFGRIDAVGQTLRLNNDKYYRIGAVIEDVPANSSVQFDWIVNFTVSEEDWMKTWGSRSFLTYVKLKPNTTQSQAEASMKGILKRYIPDNKEFPVLQPIGDTYLYGNYINGKPMGGRISYVQTFTLVGLLILLIACVNFMNLSTARSAKRAKEVGVRKVVGASRWALAGQFFGESILLNLVAAIVAVLLVISLLPGVNQVVDKQLSIDFLSPTIWLYLVILVGVTSLLAGIYPALFLSAMQPARVLKGVFAKVSAGATFRKSLVVFQFSLSLFFIVGMLIIGRQMAYIRTKQLGLDRQNIIHLPVEGELRGKMETFRQELQRSNAIRSVTTVGELPIHIGSTTSLNWPGKDAKRDGSVTTMKVGLDFAKTLDIQFVAGHDFGPADTMNCIVNESAVRMMNLKNPVGTEINKGHIIGVVRDFHTSSFHDPIRPLLLTYYPKWTNDFLIKTSPGKMAEALTIIEQLTHQLNPGYPFTYHFLDEAYEKLYRSETLVNRLINFFGVLAILISCLGLFGLATFSAEQRTKEIGVRKVLGASVSSVVALLSKDFLKLVLLAIVIASPIAWYAMTQWLQNFTYKIDIEWWMFMLAGLLAVGIALLTVGFQSIKAALMNPVKSLRSE